MVSHAAMETFVTMATDGQLYVFIFGSTVLDAATTQGMSCCYRYFATQIAEKYCQKFAF